MGSVAGTRFRSASFSEEALELMTLWTRKRGQPAIFSCGKWNWDTAVCPFDRG